MCLQKAPKINKSDLLFSVCLQGNALWRLKMWLLLVFGALSKQTTMTIISEVKEHVCLIDMFLNGFWKRK